MIINRSGIAIRLSVAECRVMGRATQGVRLINLTKKNDIIASVCKVMSSELEATAEEESRNKFADSQSAIKEDNESVEPSSKGVVEQDLFASDILDDEDK